MKYTNEELEILEAIENDTIEKAGLADEILTQLKKLS